MPHTFGIKLQDHVHFAQVELYLIKLPNLVLHVQLTLQSSQMASACLVPQTLIIVLKIPYVFNVQ
jgi:hypothetical protein